MKRSPFIALGAGTAFLAVVFGAFGAHALKTHLSSELLSVYQTAVDYHMWHAIGLIVIGLIHEKKSSPVVQTSGFLMLAGIILFSGSLYALSLSGLRILGAITPIGGVCLLIAWILLAYAQLKN